VIADAGTDVSSTSASEVTQLQQKLNTTEQRLNQLEKKRSAEVRETPAVGMKEQPPSAMINPPSAPRPPRIVYRFSPSPAGSVKPDSAPTASMHELQLPSQANGIKALQRNFTASREEWEATTDRLGSVVGELGNQRSEIDNNEESLKQVLGRFQRRDYTFTAQKGSGRQHVGPVILWLRRADPGSGRYTMRLQVNDKWVEFKDRALHEAVEFYPSNSAVPIEMLVSRIGRNQVTGRLAVPQ
jgi:hypothetical protein